MNVRQSIAAISNSPALQSHVQLSGSIPAIILTPISANKLFDSIVIDFGRNYLPRWFPQLNYLKYVSGLNVDIVQVCLSYIKYI